MQPILIPSPLVSGEAKPDAELPAKACLLSQSTPQVARDPFPSTSGSSPASRATTARSLATSYRPQPTQQGTTCLRSTPLRPTTSTCSSLRASIQPMAWCAAAPCLCDLLQIPAGSSQRSSMLRSGQWSRTPQTWETPPSSWTQMAASTTTIPERRTASARWMMASGTWSL